ncbi:unnamed protein product, partial [Staurois parvus]
ILTTHGQLWECTARRSAVRCVPRTQRITDPRKEPKMSARSCDQLCSVTADRISATCQCPSVPALSAHPCHLPVPHISAYQCTSMSHISAHLSCLCVTHQCQSVPPINASQCLSVLPVSAVYQCQSV